MKKLIMPIILLILLLSISVVEAYEIEAIELDIKGDLRESIFYNHDAEEWQSMTIFGLELKRDFGYDKRIYLHPELEYTYIVDGEDELTVDLKEGYLDIYFDTVDLRVGKQLVNWGSAYKLNPTDKINPIDLTAADPTDAELGILAVKADYYYDYDTILTGVIVGDFVSTPVPQKIIDAQTDEMGTQIFNQLMAQVQDSTIVGMMMENLLTETVEPEINSLDKLEYGIKLTHRDLFGYDVSVSAFSGFEDLPVLNSDMKQVMMDLATMKPVTVEFGYKRMNSIGLDLIGSIQDFGAWSEAAISVNEDDEKTLEAIVGGDYTFENNLYTVAQYYHRNYFDDEKESGNYVMIHGQMPFRQIHQWNATVIYDLGQQAYLINPEVNLSMMNNLKLDLGTLHVSDLSEGGNNSLLSSLGEKKTYVNLSYGF